MFKELRIKLNKISFLRFVSSTKLAVILIFLLIILVILGTFEQSINGLYSARQKYFDSYLCFVNAIPLPGVLTILWLMTFNLISSFIMRFNFSIKNLGLILSHLGLILLFVSGFFHFYYSQESFIDLKEAEKISISQSYDTWKLELKIFDEKFKLQNIYEYILNKDSKRNFVLNSETKIFIEKIYKNAKVFHTPFAGTLIKEFKPEKEYEKNIPALKILVDDKAIFLDGDENNFERIFNKGVNISLNLKREEFKLPFSIKLLDVTRELHPNSQMAKEYSSHIILEDQKLSREVTISMNKPVRSGLYTVYQARYGIDLDGNEFSVLAVVKNLNYQLPYWATLFINLGLLIHFLIKFIEARTKRSLA